MSTLVLFLVGPSCVHRRRPWKTTFGGPATEMNGTTQAVLTIAMTTGSRLVLPWAIGDANTLGARVLCDKASWPPPGGWCPTYGANCRWVYHQTNVWELRVPQTKLLAPRVKPCSCRRIAMPLSYTHRVDLHNPLNTLLILPDLNDAPPFSFAPCSPSSSCPCRHNQSIGHYTYPLYILLLIKGA